MISELNERARAVFSSIVEAYLEGGEPVGSRTLSRVAAIGGASSATIRNVMADLVEMGLLTAPHTSSGRIPTTQGLRLFIEGMMSVTALTPKERRAIDARLQPDQNNLTRILNETASVLSGLSSCAGMVIAPKRENALKQIQFVSIAPTEILVIMVFYDGIVENRLLRLDQAVAPSTLEMASNYLTAHLAGKTLDQARHGLLAQIQQEEAQLDALTRKVIAAGIAQHSPQSGILIVKGTANLLDNVQHVQDLEQIRMTMEQLENWQSMLRLVEKTKSGEGVQIFIGAENPLFDAAGLSMIVAPTRDHQNELVGAIGVIGPVHLNYGRIIPMVEYMAGALQRAGPRGL